MRWIIALPLVVFALWTAFVVSPFLALRSLQQAVEARDPQALAERINFRAMRASLTKQILETYLTANGRGTEINADTRSVASAAGTALAEPLVRDLITPEALMDWLDDGWPETKAGPVPRQLAVARPTVNWTSLGQATHLFMASETRGFRRIAMPVPPDRPAAERFTLHWRLSGMTWRLMGVDLPVPLQRRLIRNLPKPST